MMKAKIVDGKIVEIEATPYEMAEYKKFTETLNYKITYPYQPNPYPWSSPTTSPSPYTYKWNDITCGSGETASIDMTLQGSVTCNARNSNSYN